MPRVTRTPRYRASPCGNQPAANLLAAALPAAEAGPQGPISTLDRPEADHPPHARHQTRLPDVSAGSYPNTAAVTLCPPMVAWRATSFRLGETPQQALLPAAGPSPAQHRAHRWAPRQGAQR